ncbi:hypothetical protein SS1G_13954 [Sclerotinia sclerotiorum 1980 UF-70]|uniref:HTH CENPB-type domain-containing protein n=1 Tax=Sclerotinia sclerotiorum (strain ATCC 18683 / 1980 / Ss-1) TaxID=665079 RepID=A7F8M3_SCLS1|nr:hypothetical protein SS1G_13954 [Sclerotinia sclerotiorum 1980 UF-70]EDN99094.1 hypothetical protein SS1G_13954 [Sclerotinia sclerotiorum 1980 UF-70]
MQTTSKEARINLAIEAIREYHLSNWYTEGDLLYDWLIKPTTNGWTDNETGLEWIKHFNKYTETAKVHNLRKANEALSKHRRARKALIRKGGALSVEDEHNILEQENVEDQIRCDEFTNGDSSAKRQAIIRRCSKCGSASHNARTLLL